jgi:hypothetical protein
MANQEITSKKYKITVFVPLSTCACNFERFLNRTFEIMIPFRDKIEFEVKDIAGPERAEFNIHTDTVVVEHLNRGSSTETLLFTNLSRLKDYVKNNFQM